MDVIGYTEGGAIRVVFDGNDCESFVPDDMGNRHRQMIAEWESRGNVIPPYSVELNALKATLRTKIDADAEAARLRYITGGAGQAMTYQQKAAEAVALLADVDLRPEDYPLLAAEIGITADTLLGVAQVVFEAHQGWRQIGAQIEALRLNGKDGVNAAETIEEAQIATRIFWP